MGYGTISVYKEGCGLQSDARQFAPGSEEDARARLTATSPKNNLEEAMKNILVAILLMVPTLAWAEKKPAPNPADYTIPFMCSLRK